MIIHTCRKLFYYTKMKFLRIFFQKNNIQPQKPENPLNTEVTCQPDSSKITSYENEYQVFGIWQIGGLSFKEYVLQRNIPECIKQLKHNLDKQSCSTIDLLLKRFLSIPDKNRFPYYIKRKNFLKYSLSTEKEGNELKEVHLRFQNEKNQILSKYNISPYLWFYNHGLVFVPEKVEEYIKDKDFFDLGAYVGDSAYLLSFFQPKTIQSFEISDRNVDKFNSLMQEAQIDNVVLHQLALSAKDGEICFNDSGTEGNSLFSKGSNTVTVTTLDSFINNIPDCVPGLLKADIEGDEIPFLMGARETIRKFRPVMILSIYHNAEQFFETKPLIESWDLNYQFLVRRLTPAHLTAETTLIAYPKELA